MPSEQDHATIAGNMHKNLVKFGRVVIDLCGRTLLISDLVMLYL